MPRIDDQKTKKPFKKKPYRPWNLLDDDLAPVIDKPRPKLESSETVTIEKPISNQLVIVEEPSINHQVTSTPHQVTQPDTISNRFSNPISNQTIHHERPKPAEFSVEKNAFQEVQRVSGLQKKILFYIVEDCILRGELSTNPISNESLKNLTNADKDTIKTATQRLVNKNLIQRGYGKKGRGGFAIFHIVEQVRNAVIAIQKNEMSNQHLVTNWVSKKESISTYSSSSNINTTTNEAGVSQTQTVWDSLDIECLSSIGFTRSHLRQIIMDDKLPVDMVQESIYGFAFDLEKNNKAVSLKSNPLNYFMGILRSGKPYAPPANYESPRDAALRAFLERKKEADLKRQAMEDELFQIAFNEWESKLDKNERNSLLPDTVMNSRFSSEKIAHLRMHFKETIWPSVQNEYLFNK